MNLKYLSLATFWNSEFDISSNKYLKIWFVLLKKSQKSEFSYWNNLRNLNLPNESNSDMLWNMHQILGHLKGHRRTHNIEKLFPYYQCTKLFSFACSLKTHMHRRTYTGEKLFHCYQCPKILSRDHHLKNHRKTQTGETEAISLWSMY